jgi:hypothetical protein
VTADRAVVDGPGIMPVTRRPLAGNDLVPGRAEVGNPTDRAALVRSNTTECTFEHRSLAASFLKLPEH